MRRKFSERLYNLVSDQGGVRVKCNQKALFGMRFGISFNIFVSVIGIVLLLNDDHVMTLEQLQKVKDIFFGLLVRNVIV